MALTAAVVLLGLVLEHQDLLALAVLHHVGGDGGARYGGCAEGGLIPVQDGQDLVEGDGVAGFRVQLIDVEGVALGHLVLFAAGLDDRVHICTPFLYYGLAVGGGEDSLLMWQTTPIQCGYSSISTLLGIVKCFPFLFSKFMLTGQGNQAIIVFAHCALYLPTAPVYRALWKTAFLIKYDRRNVPPNCTGGVPA